jgi:pimeloyl-ACP methyl ester carboxylesterase
MSNLKYIGNFEKGRKSVLFIPGSFISPEVYNYVNLPENYQGVKVSWINSECNLELQDIAEEIIEFINENQLENVILAGYSSGGVISLLTYLAGKDVISGLLLSNTGANTVNQTNTDLPDRIRTSWKEKDSIEFIKRCFIKSVDDEMFHILLEYANNLTSEQFLRPVLSLRKINLLDKLGEIDCPVVIAHGKHDKVRGIEHAKTLNENIKNSELVLLDSGHSPMYEDSENYSKSLLKLIKIVEEN